MTRVPHVLDASALLVLLFEEPGADRVEALLPGAYVSAVNLSEVVAKLRDRGHPVDQAATDLLDLDMRVEPFGPDDAIAAGLLRPATRAAGLSLGDRACLALAQRLGAVAVTADRAWEGLVPGVRVELVR